MFEDLPARLLELQSLLAETATFQGFLADLAGLAVRSFPERVSASVTLVRDGLPETVANSDDLAARADQAQYDGQHGPCVEAYRDGVEVTIVDLENEDRFGGFPAQAATLGLRSLVALPLRSSGDAIGAFNLYATEPGVFTDGSLVRARLLTAAAAGALEVAKRMTEQTQLNEDLKTAMTSRRIIDQALGITMGKQGCDADTAFAQLRRQSQTQHRKLREIAVEIVTETAGSPPVEPPAFVPGPPR